MVFGDYCLAAILRRFPRRTHNAAGHIPRKRAFNFVTLGHINERHKTRRISNFRRAKPVRRNRNGKMVQMAERYCGIQVRQCVAFDSDFRLGYLTIS